MTKVSKLVVHRIGNKLRDEPLKLSNAEATVSDDLEDLVLGGYLKGILSPRNEHRFHHESEISLNETRYHTSAFFNGEIDFVEVSRRLATHLYSQSLHPNIRQGDLLVILFYGLEFDGKARRAIGLFKSEVLDHYLTVRQDNENLDIVPSVGINPNSIDKGALIVEGEDRVFALDRFGHRAKFWLDDFLRVRKAADSITSGKVMSYIASKVAEKIDDPLARAAYGQQFATLCDEEEQLSSVALAGIAKEYVGDDIFESMLLQAERRYGLDATDKISAPSKKINRALVGKILKLSLGHEVNLQIPPGLTLHDFKVDDVGGELRFTIRLRKRSER